MTEYGLIEIPASGPARETVLREVIAYGGSEEMLRKFFDCEEVAQSLALQQQQTAAVASRITDLGVHLMDQVEALTVRADKQRRLDAKRRADQERRAQEEAARAEAAEIRNYLNEHPEPGTSTDDTHHPGGELHSLDPVDKEHLDPEDDAGGVPLSYGNVPSSYVSREAEDEPPGIGGASEPELDPEDLGGPKDPKQVPQPVSASFW
jgi:hypothetical protein